MHVLHRPHHLHRAAVAAVTAAVLAIVLTLAIVGGLNDLSSAPASAGAPASQAVAHAPAIGSPLISNPFAHDSNPFAHERLASPFVAPVRPPWAPTAP